MEGHVVKPLNDGSIRNDLARADMEIRRIRARLRRLERRRAVSQWLQRTLTLNRIHSRVPAVL